MSLPIILQPGEGRSVEIRTSTCTFKVTGKDAHGHVGLFEYVMEPGTEGDSPHIHKQLTEIFYVVEGSVELVLDQRRVTAAPKTLMLATKNLTSTLERSV